jgi:type VI secretion system secreted protein VgrG
VADRPTQDFRLIRFRLDGSSDEGRDLLLLEGFTGQEGISFPFHYDLSLFSEDKLIDFNQVVGKPATITVILENGQKRFIHGIVSSFTQAGTSTDLTAYQATLKPDLWRLTRTADCRIFQNQSVPEIIETILDENQIVYKPSSNWDKSKYPKREYCVQYSETDSRFIARLMEDEGILYWFEHSAGKHVMALGDTIPKTQAVPFQSEADFQGGPNNNKPGPGVTAWALAQEVRPNEYSLRDFDFKAPQPIVETNSKAITVSPGSGTEKDAPKLEIYDFPGDFIGRERGQIVTDLRMEEIESGKVVISGSSTCRAFISGHVFRLKGHYRNGAPGPRSHASNPFDDFNREYLITSIFHSFREGNNFRSKNNGAQECEIYSNTFQCVPCPAKPKEFVYRPTRVTQLPVIASAQTAIVIGPGVSNPDKRNAPSPPKQPRARCRLV